MGKEKDTKRHECSCGRTFRHAISLRRHQNVTGCSELEPKAKVQAKSPEKVPASASGEVVAHLETEVSPLQIAPQKVTPEQVALWQSRLAPIPEPQTGTKGPTIDLAVAAQVLTEMGRDLGSVAQALTSFGRWSVQVGARFTFFATVIGLLGWTVLFGFSRDLGATPASPSQAHLAELSARAAVEDFLTIGRLGHYERAHKMLAPSVRTKVTPGQLQNILVALPLHQNPEALTSRVTGKETVEVVVHRAGAKEVYTLTHDSQGWGLVGVQLQES